MARVQAAHDAARDLITVATELTRWPNATDLPVGTDPAPQVEEA